MTRDNRIIGRVTVADKRKWLKESLMAAVTPEDMQDVVMMLIERARRGSIAAAKELLDRVLGKPTQEMRVEQREGRSPDEVRQSLAALLLKHPEVRDTLEKAQDARIHDERTIMEDGVIDKVAEADPDTLEDDEAA